MSAPIAVNTADGVCWTRRGALRGGEALYAPEGVCDCPPFVMATLAEVAEHGIVGSADALPMPVGPEPQQPRTVLDRARAVLGARVSKDDLQLVLGNVIDYAAELEAQRETLAARLRAGQRWQEGRTQPLVSQDYVAQDELRAIFGIELTAPWDDETSGPCDCGEGAVHYTPADCPAARRSAETGGAE